MKFPRLVASAACAVSLSAAAITAASTPAYASTARYVALGDSYSSGVGAGSYDGSSCERSSNAYPSKWAAAHSPASFTFAACSGATTADVRNNQLSALNSSTTLASITIGGNDAGFSSVMQTCVLQSDSACTTAVNNAENYMRTTLPGNLSSLYSAMKAKSPSARFVVLDYPHLYIITSFCVGLSNTKRTALNAAADLLDSTISTAASNAGFTFAEVRNQFKGHELCSGDGWLNSVTWPIGDSYHPTALGQSSGYLPVFTSAAGVAVSSRAHSHAGES
jgi:lysophospholipase L1-like esterase